MPAPTSMPILRNFAKQRASRLVVLLSAADLVAELRRHGDGRYDDQQLRAGVHPWIAANQGLRTCNACGHAALGWHRRRSTAK